jgi:beta-galactosidase
MEIKICRFKSLVVCACFGLLITACVKTGFAQGVKFNGDLSPAKGLVKPQEKPFRDELCLNGKWDFQPIAIPAGWLAGSGIAPDLTMPAMDKWETTKIKIPSPWNVNEWGSGSKVGKGTNLPYAPGSLYYPSYPPSWGEVQMGWLKRNFIVPAAWNNKRIVLHFEAVAGECVVLINGKERARNMDAYLPFDIDITDDVNIGKSNELMVGIRHRKLFDKKNALYPKMSATYPPGSNTHDLVGIWQDVFLQALPVVNVQSVFAKPFVDKDELDFDVTITNQSTQKKTITIGADVKEWVNDARAGVVTEAEINWHLGNTAIQVQPVSITLNPGESQTISLKTKVQGRLKRWSPDEPNLYTAIFTTSEKGVAIDCKTERFGWRSFTIKDKDILLNGQKIQLVGDLQHPFGPYIMSRRFAWGWYKMIKDVGGNAVRPHAQPWPRVYYDLADEMGLAVLDEDALFGSSIALNFEEDITWKRTADEIERLILRDRNHPSVIGWSVGNEIFAIALLNKPTADIEKNWDNKLGQLAQIPLLLDPTRSLVTSDGDKDLDGRLPVWSKHFGHGLKLDQLPHINKPLIIGESGATYYGKPHELFPFIGLKAYGSYYERNEALAIDVYQNIVQMQRPLLAYFSPSELCWFGIEHMNLGYHDYSRLPDEQDGIFPANPYEEGKPGYQYERIPPYVTTFNPGLDPALPVYKPLPMFDAMKAALTKGGPQPNKWDHFQDTSYQRPVYPAPLYNSAIFIGKKDGPLNKLFNTIGLNMQVDAGNPSLMVIDGESLSDEDLKSNKAGMDKIKSNGGLIWILTANGHLSNAAKSLLPAKDGLAPFKTTALQSDSSNTTGRMFNLRDLYFSEINGDKNIIKYAFEGDILKKSATILKPANTDWFLFSAAPENRKCAQEVLYEHLQKPQAAALITIATDKGTIVVSSIDFNIQVPETLQIWRKLCAAMAIKLSGQQHLINQNNKKGHNLLMDGPVN